MVIESSEKCTYCGKGFETETDCVIELTLGKISKDEFGTVGWEKSEGLPPLYAHLKCSEQTPTKTDIKQNNIEE